MSYNLPEQLKILAQLGITVKAYSFPKYEGPKKDLLGILRNEEPLQPEEDGFLFREDEKAHFYLVVEMPLSDKLRAVNVSGSENKILTELNNVRDQEQDNNSVFIKGIGTHFVVVNGIKEGCSTKPPMNSLRIVSTLDNIFKMFEVGIATRSFEKEGCLHFLTVQEVYKGQLYFDTKTERISIPAEEYPGYRNWDSLRDLVEEMTDWRELPISVTPEIPDYSSPQKINEGVVSYFNFSTGMGMAKLSDNCSGGVHWKQIADGKRFPCFLPGQRIKFSGTYTGKMIKLIDVKPL